MIRNVLGQSSSRTPMSRAMGSISVTFGMLILEWWKVIDDLKIFRVGWDQKCSQPARLKKS